MTGAGAGRSVFGGDRGLTSVAESLVTCNHATINARHLQQFACDYYAHIHKSSSPGSICPDALYKIAIWLGLLL